PLKAVDIPASADAYVNASLPGSNFGAAANVNVGGGNQGLVRFDIAGALSAGVTSANVGKAVLYIFVNKVNTAGNIDISTAAVAWNESTVSQSSAPVAGTPVAVGLPATTGNAWIAVDTTQVVKNWVDFPGRNNGYLLTAN